MGSVSSDGDLVNPGEGFPHPRSYGAFARVLAHYVRASGALSLEQAVHKMSWMNARALNLHKRGVIGEGWFADLVLFDAGLVEDRATYQDPHRYATGIDYVIINGKLVLDQGELTGERPGRVLKLLAPD
jgi:N-acyl-D-aspartate/D-glutamate deacylase